MANALVRNAVPDYTEASDPATQDWGNTGSPLWDDRANWRLRLQMALADKEREARLARGEGSTEDLLAHIGLLPVHMMQGLSEAPASIARSAAFAAGAGQNDATIRPDETQAEFQARMAGQPDMASQAVEAGGWMAGLGGGSVAPVTTNRLVLAGKAFGREPVLPEAARIAADRPFARVPAEAPVPPAEAGTQAMTQAQLDDAVRGLGQDPAQMTPVEKMQAFQGARGATLYSGGNKKAAALALAGQGRKGLYVKSAQVVADKLPETFTPERAAATLDNAGIKGDELASVKAYLQSEADWRSRPGSNQPPEISKQELIDAIHEGMPQLKEWQRGGGAADHVGLDEDGFYRLMDEDGFPISDETYAHRDEADRAMSESGIATGKPLKYGKYTLPGGRNKREIGLQYERPTPTEYQVGERTFASMPEAALESARTGDHILPVAGGGEGYRGKHWKEPDEVDTFVHSRIDERQVIAPGYVVENAKSGNKSPVFHTFEDAQNYQKGLPQKADTIVVKTKQPVDALHVDELQNDPAQDARKHGWATPEAKAKVEEDTAKAQENLAQKGDEMNAALDEGIAFVTTKWPTAGGLPTTGKVHRANIPFTLRHIMNAPDKFAPEIVDRAGILENKIVEARAAVAQAGRDLDTSLGAGENLIPDLPFKKTEQWSGLMWKRLIQEAVARGKDWITWTTGAVQNDRYRLSNHVSALHYDPVVEGGETKYVVKAKTVDGGHWVAVNQGEAISAKELPAFVGEELAGKIAKGEGEPPAVASKEETKQRFLYDVDVNVGGKGMEGYYDDMTPKIVGGITKKHGVKIEKAEPVGVPGTIDKRAEAAIRKARDAKAEEIKRGFDAEMEGIKNDSMSRLKERVEKEGGATEKMVREAIGEADAARDVARRKFHDANVANLNEFTNALKATRQPVELHAFHITPQLKAAAQNEGFTLYAGGKRTLVGAALARAQRRYGLEQPMTMEERMAAEGAAPAPAGPPAPGDPEMAHYLEEQAAQIAQRNAPKAAKPKKEPKAAPPPTPPVEEAAIQLDPPERALAVTDLLHDKTPKSTVRRGVPEVAKELQDRGRAALRAMGIRSGRVTEQTTTPAINSMLARVIAHEVSYEMRRGGKAEDWYTGSVADAMHVAAILHPEIGTNPYAAMAYKLSLAITSQGEKVTSNTRLADGVYARYKATGRFPTDIDVKADEQINGNLKKINKILDEAEAQGKNGLRVLNNFLNKEFTVKELLDKKWKVSGENMQTTVHGSAVLGAKIGNGFYQNLRGNYTPTTFDLWFMRGWNRLTGNLVGQLDKESLQKIQDKYAATLDIQKPRTRAALVKLAREDTAKHEKDYRDNRVDYDREDDDPLKKTKSLRTLAATRFLHAIEGVNQMPTGGGQRIWMRQVIDEVRGNLAAEGIHMTNADIQALWWYPEKDLFAKLGGKDADALKMNYYEALKALAIEKGVFKNDAEAVAAVEARKRRRLKRPE